MTSCGDFEDGASGRLAPAREVLRDEMRAGGGGEMAAGEADTPTLGADGEEAGARNVGRACRGAWLGKRAQQPRGLALDIGRGGAGFRMPRPHCASPEGMHCACSRSAPSRMLSARSREKSSRASSMRKQAWRIVVRSRPKASPRWV